MAVWVVLGGARQMTTARNEPVDPQQIDIVCAI